MSEQADGPAGATSGATPPSKLPTGCRINLAGRWRLLGASGVVFDLQDNGERVVATRVGVEPGDVPDTLILERSESGFAGSIRETVRVNGGRTCAVAFASAVTRCSGTRLHLKVQEGARVDRDCEFSGEPAIRERVLVRQ